MNPFDKINQFDALAAFSMCVKNFLAQIPVEVRLAAEGVAIIDDYSFEGCNPICYSDFPDTKRILDAIAATGNCWTLHRTDATDTTKRKIKIFRVTHRENKTICDFTVNGEPRVHVLMFSVSAESESKFWVARRSFKSFFSVMMQAGFLSVQGNALTNVEKNPLNKTGEWRNATVSLDGRPVQKLKAFWIRLGAIELDGNLTFLREREANITKQFAEASGEKNPYRHLARSVYAAEFEKQLRR